MMSPIEDHVDVEGKERSGLRHGIESQTWLGREMRMLTTCHA